MTALLTTKVRSTGTDSSNPAALEPTAVPAAQARAAGPVAQAPATGNGTAPASPAKRVHEFKRAPRALLQCLSSTALEIRRRHCHRDLGFSSLRDYVRARPGLTWNTWSGLIRLGTVLGASPRASIQFEQGALPPSIIERMASQAAPSRWDALADELAGMSTREAFARLRMERIASETSRGSPIADDDLVRVSISMPAAVASYVEETLELASYLLGDDATPEQQMEAVCAEVASELTTSVQPEEARDRYRSGTRASHRPASPAVVTGEPEARRNDEPQPASDKDSATELDQRLVQLIHTQARLDTWREDELLSMGEEDVHGQCGCPRLSEFAETHLEIPSSTAEDMLRRARERRAGHPLALARAAGTLTSYQFDLLYRLHRRAGVPRSCLALWIAEAVGTTTRLLSAKVQWAIQMSRDDYLSWSRSGFAPPSDDELRASTQSPTDIASDPSLPDFQLPTEELFARPESPPTDLVALRWTLSSGTSDMMFQLMATISDRARLVASRRTGLAVADLPHPPPWWALLKIMHLARLAWVDHARPATDRKWHRATLERDRYRCGAPECTKRSTLQVHHIHYAGRGGGNELTNLVTLCHYHHQHGEHGGRIRVRGRATRGAQDLQWNMGIMGHWHGDRRSGGKEKPRHAVSAPAFVAGVAGLVLGVQR